MKLKRELLHKFEETVDLMKSQEPLMEALKGIKEFCNPKDAELLQELNVKESEEEAKKIEEEEEHSHHPDVTHRHNLREGFGNTVKHGLAATTAAVGLAVSAIPALVMLPICLIPVTIASLIGIIGAIHWEKKGRTNGSDAFVELTLMFGYISIPFVVAGVCFSPAILLGSPFYLTSAAIEIVPNLIANRQRLLQAF